MERALIQHRQGPLLFRQEADLQEERGVSIPLAGRQRPPTLAEMNRECIEKALEQTGGRINGAGGAAEILGIHPNTLRNRMNRLGIAYGRKRAGSRNGRPG